MKYTALRKWHLSVIATFRQHFCFCTLQIPLCKFSKHQIPDACWFSYGFELTVRAWSVKVLHVTVSDRSAKVLRITVSDWSAKVLYITVSDW